MGREIKFRAWYKSQKEMWFKIIGTKTDEYFEANFYKCELMMYTGLKDKNKKEIYEGDIVNIGESYHAVPCEVIFSEGCFSIIPQWMKDETIPLKEYCNKVFINCVEVVGNIHENPGLIK